MTELSPAEFAARMASAREAGRPFFPWDDLTVEAWRRSLQAIERTVRQALGSEDPHASPIQLEDPRSSPIQLEAPDGARALGIAAFTSGTGPLLGHWIERGELVADPEAATLLTLHLDHGRKRLERLTSAFQQVVDLFADVGVTPTLVKGFHTAHALFPDSAARPMSDLDMVIAPDELARVSAALERAGFRRGRHLRRPYMTEWLPPGPLAVPRSLDLTHEANPWTLDLHTGFARDFGGVRVVSLVPEERGAEGVTDFCEIAGREVRVLAQPYLTVYLAAHASQELKNLMLIRLIELVWSTRYSLDWGELADLLERQRAAAYVYPAFELAGRLVPGAVPADFRRMLEASALPRVRRVIGGLRPSTAQRLESVSLEEHFMWADEPLDYLRRARRALWPSWAGSLHEALQVLSARARQLLRGRVSLSRRDPPRE